MFKHIGAYKKYFKEKKIKQLCTTIRKKFDVTVFLYFWVASLIPHRNRKVRSVLMVLPKFRGFPSGPYHV